MFGDHDSWDLYLVAQESVIEKPTLGSKCQPWAVTLVSFIYEN